mmetsp:Transcript_23945/g.64765  ORF Transcript_23945/g.64765 Transcript_23945/m.64765 type:complete len:97 (+) Transcript_23945:2112-2402(+)
MGDDSGIQITEAFSSVTVKNDLYVGDGGIMMQAENVRVDVTGDLHCDGGVQMTKKGSSVTVNKGDNSVLVFLVPLVVLCAARRPPNKPPSTLSVRT